MKKIFKTICLIIFGAIFLAGGLLWINPAQAQDDGLVVEYWTDKEWKKWLPGEESFPIFKEENFLPGDTVIRQVRVTNNSGRSQRIATEAINVTDPDRLSDVLNLEIKEGSTILYRDALSKFFAAGEVYLSDLADGEDTQYDFIVSFYSGTGNVFQGKSVSFDLLIGFQGTEGGLLPGAGGGAGGFLPSGLTILNETATTTETTATVTWQTSYLSTSKVVYDTQPGRFDLSVGEPSYGYSFYKEGDDSGKEKVTFHSVTLTDLTPGTTYYYRCISHASPPTISREFSFKTLPLEKPLEKKEKPKKLLETKPKTKPTLSALSKAIFKAKKEEFVAKEKPEIRKLVKKETLEEKTKKTQKIETEEGRKEKKSSISYKGETAKKTNKFLAFLKNLGLGWLMVLIIILIFGVIVYYLNKKRS